MNIFRIIPRYGNYGAPGYSAGIYNDNPELTDWSIAPTDDMDKAFKYHDYHYQHQNFVHTIYKADKDLVDDLISIGNPWAWKISPKTMIYAFLYRQAAIKLFFLKMLWEHLKLLAKSI